MCSYKYSDDRSGFVSIGEVIPDAVLDIRYYSDYNFIGERIDGYEAPVALITKEAGDALFKVSEELSKKGLGLKIYDAYRPQCAVDHFVRWAKDLSDERMKDIFYPMVPKAELFSLGYIASHSGHSRGSTVDLTLVDRQNGTDIDMGSAFDYFGEISHSDFDIICENGHASDSAITKEQYANRMLLKEVMTSHGFIPLAEEWWHFTLKDEPFPDTYFTFPVTGRIS